MSCSICKKFELCKSLDRANGICSKFVAASKVRKRPTFEESELQTECLGWFNTHFPERKGLFFSIPNGANVAKSNRERLVREGMTSGVADTLLTIPSFDGRYHCLGIEFKKKTFRTKKSKSGYTLSEGHTNQSPEQKEWQRNFEAAGNRYEVVWDKEQFKSIILEHMLGVKNN